MISIFNQKLLRVGAIIGLYICLLAASVCILQENTNSKQYTQKEIINNEIETMKNLKKIYNAQKRYHAVDWDEDGINNYAQFIVHLWQTVDKNAYPVKTNLIQKSLAFAMGESKAINGYFFKNIYFKKNQNSSINTSANNHKDKNQEPIDINIANEWAITAIPADYGKTGTLTFIVGSSGKIYVKDIQSNRIKSIPDNLISENWHEVADEDVIGKLHT
ncbi:MAG: DUF2950 domain-containing protein [Desulfobacteraceae bacterium]|nr:DUF2950 domain-containing protein [Desulfobacteraceae bacterium]